MTAALRHNPRVIAGPNLTPAADEIAALAGQQPALGQWVLKLDAVAETQIAELARAAEVAGAQLWHDDTQAILQLPVGDVESFLDSLAPSADSLAEAIRAVIEAWPQRQFRLDCGGGELLLGHRTLVMGIVNVTPDSFSDGGEFLDHDAAIAHGERLAEEGADLLDIGGESTRPGAQAVDAEEECRRVLPIIERLAESTDVPISIDTSKADVARRALGAGAVALNDVTALRGDPQMPAVAAESGAPLCLMHMQGTPRTMQKHPHYDDLMGEIIAYLRESMARAVEAGVRESQLLVDPGIGFGKTVEHNLAILRHLPELRSLGRPILLGTSRKSFIGKILDLPVDQRLLGTASTAAYGIAQGAHIIRVHDVAEMTQVARMTDAMVGNSEVGSTKSDREG